MPPLRRADTPVFRLSRLVGLATATALLLSAGLNAQATSQSEVAAVNTIAQIPSDDTVPLVLTAPGMASTPSDSVVLNAAWGSDPTIGAPGVTISVHNHRSSLLTVDNEGIARLRPASPGGSGDSTLIRATDTGVQILSRTNAKRIVETTYTVGTSSPNQLLHQGPNGELYVLAPSAEVPAEQWSAPLLGDVELTDYHPDPADDEPVEDPDPEVEIPEGYLVRAVFGQPWAVDTGTGQHLPSTFVVSGNTVTQRTDATQATGPVISDPFFVPIAYIVIGAAARHLVAAGARAIIVRGAVVRGATYTVKGGYSTFKAFKKANGTKKGYDWHHIVEQGNIGKKKWAPEAIHHRNNLIAIPKKIHEKCINSWMASAKGFKKFGITVPKGTTMRSVVREHNFARQHEIGLALLRHCGVEI